MMAQSLPVMPWRAGDYPAVLPMLQPFPRAPALEQLPKDSQCPRKGGTILAQKHTQTLSQQFLQQIYGAKVLLASLEDEAPRDELSRGAQGCAVGTDSNPAHPTLLKCPWEKVLLFL